MPLQSYTARGGHAENTEEMESHHLASAQIAITLGVGGSQAPLPGGN